MRRPRARRCAAGTPPGPRNAGSRTVPVAVDCQLADDVLRLTAQTPRLGAAYHDTWSISPSLALTWMTVADASVPLEPSYVSRAAVAAASLVRDTTYTFSYAIVMRTAGRAWAGSRSVAVTVGPDGSATWTAVGHPPAGA